VVAVAGFTEQGSWEGPTASVTVNGNGGTDTLVVNGSAANDTFAVAAVTGAVGANRIPAGDIAGMGFRLRTVGDRTGIQHNANAAIAITVALSARDAGILRGAEVEHRAAVDGDAGAAMASVGAGATDDGVVVRQTAAVELQRSTARAALGR